MINVQIEELNEAIKGVLDEYNETVVNGLKKNTKKAMDDLVKSTKTTAPVGKRSKHYRDSITSKTLGESKSGISRLWYVRGSDYRLSHLLNDGHALRDGGRYNGTKFITKAVDTIIPKYLEAIEEVIKNG